MPSRLISCLGTTEEFADLFSDSSVLAALLAFESGLARAQARLGLIPQSAAAAISGAAVADGFHAAAIAREARQSASVAIPLVNALAARVRVAGAAFVECPVGGSTGPARQGKLIGLMGAEPADAARARPLLDQLCRRIEHCGPVGAGATMKLTINLPLMVYWQALGEALALTQALPVAPERLMDLLSDTSGAATIAKVRAPGIAAMLKGGDPGPVTFNVDGGIKDMRAMLAEAKSQGIELPLVDKTLACYEETKRHRSGGAEISTVSAYWASRGQQ